MTAARATSKASTRKGSSSSAILLPPLKDQKKLKGPVSPKGKAEQGKVGTVTPLRTARTASEQACQDARTAAQPQHGAASDRSTKAHLLRDYRFAFPFSIRERIVETHQNVHDLLHVRVRQADGCRHQPATMAGMAAEIRAISDAAKNGTSDDVRAALISVAASAILLAEEVSRPVEVEQQRRVWGGKKKEAPRVWGQLSFFQDAA